MYNIDEMIIIGQEKDLNVCKNEQVALAFVDRNKLIELIGEVLYLLSYDEKYIYNGFDQQFLTVLFGTGKENLSRYNDYVRGIDQAPLMELCNSEGITKLVKNFIDRIAINLHEMIVMNIGTAGRFDDLRNIPNLVSKCFKVYKDGGFEDIDKDHLSSASKSLGEIILSANVEAVKEIQDIEEVRHEDYKAISEDLRKTIEGLLKNIRSIIDALPYNEVFLYRELENNRVEMYKKSTTEGYISITTLYKSIDEKLRLDVNEGTINITIDEFLMRLPELN